MDNMDCSNQIFQNEIDFYIKVKHPFISKYIESFSCKIDDYSPTCIVLELADGLDLHKRMICQKKGIIPEELALTYFTQIALALQYLHSEDIMHRDVKPLNFLIYGEQFACFAMLTDFGSTKVVEGQNFHTQAAGTKRYFAPERKNKDYSDKADVWSLGISLHEMLTEGSHPFIKPESDSYLENLEESEMRIKLTISKPVQELLKFLLVKDPSKRPEMEHVLNHPLVKNKIILITDNLTNGEFIGDFIRDQVKDILDRPSTIEQETQTIVSENTNETQTDYSLLNELTFSNMAQNSIISPQRQLQVQNIKIIEIPPRIPTKPYSKILGIIMILLLLIKFIVISIKGQINILGIEIFRGESHQDYAILINPVLSNESIRNVTGLNENYHFEHFENLTNLTQIQQNSKNQNVTIPINQANLPNQTGSQNQTKNASQAEIKSANQTNSTRQKAVSNAANSTNHTNQTMTKPADQRNHKNQTQKNPKNQTTNEAKFTNQTTIFTKENLNSFLQQIREEGHTKLVDAAINHGLSVSKLNEKLTVSNMISQFYFEGLTNRGGYSDLLPGVYYGQHVNGLREGYGLLFTSEKSVPFLYECEWAKGMPIKGRWIYFFYNVWEKYEGQLDELYLMTGTGNWEDQDGWTYQGQWQRNNRHGYGIHKWADGDSYQGEYKDHNMHGQGIYRWADGDSYDGLWQNDNKHGLGRYTYSSGEYQQGQWENDKRVGEHKKYSKEQKLIELITYEDGKKVKKEETK
ncbi:hypothetical protein FGO68_gene11606 [Halteria grandinella]|uniref:Protein kinase domain-containing protein n=1 Tax=Halteria grandinella TaxID=5974 RepID=A0A8J8P0N3_HALGN|nr:hypothetical protein FGO68_gene11606 [Halteria grandinella]